MFIIPEYYKLVNFNNSNFNNDDFNSLKNVDIVKSRSNDDFNMSSGIHAHNININDISHELDLRILIGLRKKFVNNPIIGS